MPPSFARMPDRRRHRISTARTIIGGDSRGRKLNVRVPSVEIRRAKDGKNSTPLILIVRGLIAAGFGLSFGSPGDGRCLSFYW